MVRDGAFREDLFYRLNVIPLRLPPLRERREDIPMLVQHFLDRIGRDQSPPRLGVGVSQEAMRLLMAYSWPGNVRQLENTVERAFTLSPGRTQIDDSALPEEIRQAVPDDTGWSLAVPEQGLDLEAFVARVEREVIARALDRTGGNKRRAAALLNLKRTTLVEKLKRFARSEAGADKRDETS
jgi:DNA-binding NtrC family response regulator